MVKPDCYKCEYRRNIPGDAHSRCDHPRVVSLQVEGDRHGRINGWFIWP